MQFGDRDTIGRVAARILELAARYGDRTDAWRIDAGRSAVSSVLAYPEGRAALAAARRGRRLTPRADAQALAEFEALNDELALVGIDAELAHRAGELADEMKLRGYDAVHLASALALGDASTVVVTWDAELNRAAAAAGLAVAPGL